MDCEKLLVQLDSFDTSTRRTALEALVQLCPQRPPEKPYVKMHMHTFFSFNGEGHSPARLMWDARQAGLYAVATCDFDVLDALDETIAAADVLQMRAAVSFESRVFFSEYAACDINSPGEPGVFYFMGCGFVSPPKPGTAAAKTLTSMLEQSHRRNRDMIRRINDNLPGLTLDYENDVLPLTPARNATERHIVRGYYEKALALHHGDAQAAARWWAERFGMEAEALVGKANDANVFMDMLRSKLMKNGGLGYIQPTAATFPPLDQVVAMILECRAIPTSAWLDGTSAGEAEPEQQLECLIAKGVAAVNVIPDRNWNVGNADKQRHLVAEMNRYIAAANRLSLPIFVGTELNKHGQRFIDDFDAEPMAPHRDTFIQGARVLTGHTRLLRWADVSYTDDNSVAEWPDPAERNRVFAAAGALPPPSVRLIEQLDETPGEKAFNVIMDAIAAGRWPQ